MMARNNAKTNVPLAPVTGDVAAGNLQRRPPTDGASNTGIKETDRYSTLYDIISFLVQGILFPLSAPSFVLRLRWNAPETILFL